MLYKYPINSPKYPHITLNGVVVTFHQLGQAFFSVDSQWLLLKNNRPPSLPQKCSETRPQTLFWAFLNLGYHEHLPTRHETRDEHPLSSAPMVSQSTLARYVLILPNSNPAQSFLSTPFLNIISLASQVSHKPYSPLYSSPQVNCYYLHPSSSPYSGCPISPEPLKSALFLSHTIWYCFLVVGPP